MSKNRPKSAKMTVTEAITFDHESMTNMAAFFEYQLARNETIVCPTCQGQDEDCMDCVKLKLCECEPYQDVFTYQRWLAQGMQVRRGEHGCKITTWVPKDRENPDKGVFPRITTVFCRCQVDRV